MFERLQKPFLTVETGEAYQPIRLTWKLAQKDAAVAILNNLKCCEKNTTSNTWSLFWRDECHDLPFESLDTFKRNPEYPLRLSTITIRDDNLYLNFTSFKRACLTIPFFRKLISEHIAKIHHADFINKVFGLDERLPHGFTELFKEDELEHIINQRISDYAAVQHRCEQAATATEALSILSTYTNAETQKRLPYAERYTFQGSEHQDPDVLFLSFYIFLRGRELVAIRRWFGNTSYTLSDVAEETIEQVFGEINVELIA